MPELEFSKFAIRYSSQARQSLQALDEDVRRIADMILHDDIANDPKGPREELQYFPGGRWIKYDNLKKAPPRIQITYSVTGDIIDIVDVNQLHFKINRTLFISYSHLDREWLDALRPYLFGLEQSGLIDFWDDSRLEPGKLWASDIERALKDCIGGVLLVSSDFLASKFVVEVELPRLLDAAIANNKKIFWFLVRPYDNPDNAAFKRICAYQALLDKPHEPLSSLNDVARKTAFEKIALGIRAATTN